MQILTSYCEHEQNTGISFWFYARKYRAAFYDKPERSSCGSCYRIYLYDQKMLRHYRKVRLNPALQTQYCSVTGTRFRHSYRCIPQK